MLPRRLTLAPRPRIDSGNGQCSSSNRVRHRVVRVLLADDSKRVTITGFSVAPCLGGGCCLRNPVPPMLLLSSYPICSRAVFHLIGHRSYAPSAIELHASKELLIHTRDSPEDS